MTRGFCRCESPSPQAVEGVWLCRECGDRLADPLLLLVARQQREILARLKRLESDRDRDETTPDRLLKPAELAERLGTSAQWIREHTEELGGIRIGDGPRPRYLFNLDRARERLAARLNRPKSEPPTEKRPGRHKRSSNGVPLLPVRDRA
jgi:hypothetical protein